MEKKNIGFDPPVKAINRDRDDENAPGCTCLLPNHRPFILSHIKTYTQT